MRGGWSPERMWQAVEADGATVDVVYGEAGSKRA